VPYPSYKKYADIGMLESINCQIAMLLDISKSVMLNY